MAKKFKIFSVDENSFYSTSETVFEFYGAKNASDWASKKINREQTSAILRA